MHVRPYCDYPWTKVRVTSEGYASFCCHMRDQDPSDKIIGNVLEATFEEVWYGPVAEEVRKATLGNSLHYLCDCSGCPVKCGIVKHHDLLYGEYPRSLEIDLPNTHCNVGGMLPTLQNPACIMCERSHPNFKPEKERLKDVLKALKHIVQYLSNLHIQGLAEPFLQNSANGFLLFDVLDDLGFDKHAHQITFSTTTNATLLKSNVIDHYLKRVPKSNTVFSIDAANADTFKRIRIFDCFERVIDNIREFEAKRNRSSQFTKIHCNVNTLNVKEVPDIVRLARDLGVDTVEFNPTMGFNKDILVNQQNCGDFAKAELLAMRTGREIGQEVKIINPLDGGLFSYVI